MGKTTGITQGSFKDGEKDGPWVDYYVNGRIKKKGTDEDSEKDSPWVRYHKNGQLERKGTFKDGLKDKQTSTTQVLDRPCP